MLQFHAAKMLQYLTVQQGPEVRRKAGVRYVQEQALAGFAGRVYIAQLQQGCWPRRLKETNSAPLLARNVQV